MSVTPEQVQADLYRLITRLAADLGHEVKNPLHAMAINLELLRRRVQSGELDDALVRVQVVEEQITRVNDLVGALIQLLRPDRSAAAVVEMDLALGDLLPLLNAQARLARVTLHHERAGDGALVALGRDALRHLVLSLVTRTLDALRPFAGSHLEIRASAGNGQVRLRVAGHPGSADEGTPGRLAQAGGSRSADAWSVIARAIAAEAGGRLAMEGADEGGGLAYEVLFPAADLA